MSDYEREYKVLHAMPLGVCIFDAGYVVRFWNRCLESWTKVNAADIVGKRLGEFYPHLMQPKFMSRFDSLFRGGPPAIFSARLHGSIIPSALPGGEARLQHTVARPLDGCSSSSGCVLMTMQDVTEAHMRLRDYARMHELAQTEIAMRKEIETHLRESEERYRVFFESAEAIKLILRPGSGDIVDANGAAESFYGYDADQLRGLTIFDMLPDRHDPALREAAAAAMNEDGHFFFRHRVASGDIRDVDMHTCRIQHRGETLVMSSVHDMTELRRLEQIKVDVERIVHHDLKSPLTGLINIPQMVMEEDNITEEQRKMLSLVVVSGRKMLSLINSSLELHKIESGTYVFYPEPCNLQQVVRDNVEVLTVSMGLEPTVVRVEMVPADIDPASVRVETDSRLLDVIIMNVLRNALEACDWGRTVGVELLLDSEHDVVIRISNNRAVPEEIRDRFFEKYATAGKNGGTGLGTYSAALMTRALGGTISMHSTEESGTRVTVRIPRKK